jgi:hypothetical protein
MFYAKWNVADNAISTVGKFIDIFVINYLVLDRAALGYYGLATIFYSRLIA